MIAPASSLPSVPKVDGLHSLRTNRGTDRSHILGAPLADEFRNRSHSHRRAFHDDRDADQRERAAVEYGAAPRAEVGSMRDEANVSAGSAGGDERGHGRIVGRAIAHREVW